MFRVPEIEGLAFSLQTSLGSPAAEGIADEPSIVAHAALSSVLHGHGRSDSKESARTYNEHRHLILQARQKSFSVILNSYEDTGQ